MGKEWGSKREGKGRRGEGEKKSEGEGIGFALDQLVSASRLWIFQIGINFRTLDLIGFMFLDFNRYRFNFFGFKLVSALGLRFWIGIDFGFLDLIGIGSGSLGFGLVGFASLNISDR
ncbi:hypothetical protein RhiirA5_433631 [Rhizophagus irregularis]|uniref:Uncharacterized protein n=1 Tax=Rhizophagus irregularis TaxID=588596 RepID=A0A2N0NRE6_9GLOM|nr:hypothetical protein RhiirA5_433631 [Rhizophagus irregularis]